MSSKQQSQSLPDRDPLDAIPMLPEHTEVMRDKSTGLQVRRRLIQKSKLIRSFEKIIGPRWRRLHLDERGAAYYRQVDGQRSLREIATNMAEELAVDADQTEEAVLLFTRDLMLRGMIVLDLGTAPDPTSTSVKP